MSLPVTNVCPRGKRVCVSRGLRANGVEGDIFGIVYPIPVAQQRPSDDIIMVSHASLSQTHRRAGAGMRGNTWCHPHWRVWFALASDSVLPVPVGGSSNVGKATAIAHL